MRFVAADELCASLHEEQRFHRRNEGRFLSELLYLGMTRLVTDTNRLGPQRRPLAYLRTDRQ